MLNKQDPVPTRETKQEASSVEAGLGSKGGWKQRDIKSFYPRLLCLSPD